MNINEMFNSILNDEKVIDILRELEDYHEETYEHCLRVGLLCMFLGERNNLNEEEIKSLGYAGLLHDVGKLDISLNILNKEERLEDEERIEIETHTERGFERLNNFEGIKNIVRYHHVHQKKDYPKNGECDEKKCILSQVIAISDMFDALANKRAYKDSFSNDKIKEILEKEFTGEKIYIEQVLEICKDGEERGI